MKVDTVVKYMGKNCIAGFCRARWYEHQGKNVVVLSEHDDNSGPSITNAANMAAAAAAREFGGLISRETIFIEHYTAQGHRDEATYDLVEFTSCTTVVTVKGVSHEGFGNTIWKPLGAKRAEELCGELPV